MGDGLRLAHHWLLNQAEAHAQELAAKIRGYLERFHQISNAPLSQTICLEAEAIAALNKQDAVAAKGYLQQAVAGAACNVRMINCGRLFILVKRCSRPGIWNRGKRPLIRPLIL